MSKTIQVDKHISNVKIHVSKLDSHSSKGIDVFQLTKLALLWFNFPLLSTIVGWLKSKCCAPSPFSSIPPKYVFQLCIIIIIIIIVSFDWIIGHHQKYISMCQSSRKNRQMNFHSTEAIKKKQAAHNISLSLPQEQNRDHFHTSPTYSRHTSLMHPKENYHSSYLLHGLKIMQHYVISTGEKLRHYWKDDGAMLLAVYVG